MPLALKNFGNKSGNPVFWNGPPAGGLARGHSDTSCARQILLRGARIGGSQNEK